MTQKRVYSLWLSTWRLNKYPVKQMVTDSSDNASIVIASSHYVQCITSHRGEEAALACRAALKWHQYQSRPRCHSPAASPWAALPPVPWSSTPPANTRQTGQFFSNTAHRFLSPTSTLFHSKTLITTHTNWGEDQTLYHFNSKMAWYNYISVCVLDTGSQTDLNPWKTLQHGNRWLGILSSVIRLLQGNPT